MKLSIGVDGGRRDPVSVATHLGNGYRAYHPVLMRFHCPDSLSPFGAGGLNAYTYCDADPVNHRDPSGHLSGQAWLGIGMGIIGLGLALFSAGTSIAAAGGVMAAVESASALSLVMGAAGVLSDVAAIASGSAEGSHPQASASLGWVALGLGIVGIIKGASGLAGRSSRPFGSLMITGERVTTGQFRHPRYLGLASGETHGFDFFYEDTTPSGLHRLNIVTHEEIHYGINPTLPVRVWGADSGTNEVVQYSPLSEQASPLIERFLTENGHRYPVYRFGVSHAADTLPAFGRGERVLYSRNFMRLFSARMQGAVVQASKGKVTFTGEAWRSLDYLAAQWGAADFPLSRQQGQLMMNVVAGTMAGRDNVFTMESEQWFTYLNGRIRR